MYFIPYGRWRPSPPRRPPWAPALAALLAAALVGCPARGTPAAAPVPAPAPAAAPARVVSLGPNLTEILYAVGAADRVVAVTSDCDEPADVRTLPRVGPYGRPDLESIVALAPDLVLIPEEGNLLPASRRLAAAGLAVRTVGARTYDDVIEAARVVGRLVGREADGSALADRLASRRDEVRHRVAGLPAVGVLLAFGRSPLYAAGPGTFADDLIRTAGGRNVLSDARTAYPEVSLEGVLDLAPAAIVDAAMGDSTDGRTFWAAWPQIPAVRSGRVLLIDPDLVARAGPRLADGLEAIARHLHPEAFVGR